MTTTMSNGMTIDQILTAWGEVGATDLDLTPPEPPAPTVEESLFQALTEASAEIAELKAQLAAKAEPKARKPGPKARRPLKGKLSPEAAEALAGALPPKDRVTTITATIRNRKRPSAELRARAQKAAFESQNFAYWGLRFRAGRWTLQHPDTLKGGDIIVTQGGRYRLY